MEDYKSCDNCKFDGLGAADEPCVRCSNTSLFRLSDYKEKPFLWERIDAAEAVDHPSHYNQGKYECIDVMIDVFGVEDVKAFCKLNAFKYNWRSKQKNGVEDIKKAKWYLEKYIELEGESNE